MSETTKIRMSNDRVESPWYEREFTRRCQEGNAHVR
jgi:hypothetical protein